MLFLCNSMIFEYHPNSSQLISLVIFIMKLSVTQLKVQLSTCWNHYCPVSWLNTYTCVHIIFQFWCIFFYCTRIARFIVKERNTFISFIALMQEYDWILDVWDMLGVPNNSQIGYSWLLALGWEFSEGGIWIRLLEEEELKTSLH